MMQSVDKKLNKIDDLFEFSTHETFQNLHFKWNPKYNLRAIVAIHNTKLGPSLGGCRFVSYPDTDSAIVDALRLARGMSYKSAMAGLDFGGGKAVIIKPATLPDRVAFFEAFGDFVNELGGRYITAKDSGTTLEDMDVIATRTPYVASTSDMIDPSPFTSLGIKQGIMAAVKFKFDQDHLDGLHVAIQGVGSVGYYLSKFLHALGAQLTVCDVDQAATDRCVEEFGAKVVAPEMIYQVDCDIFAPCALGAIINDQTIPMLKAKIIAGGANNQLAQIRHGQVLHDLGILYAPDYIINAGGVIHATYKYQHRSEGEANQKINDLYSTLLDIFVKAKQLNKPTNVVADEIAYKKLHD